MNKTKIWALGIAIVMVLMMLTTVLGIATAVDLVAGQNIDVGTVTVRDDGTNLFVTYETTTGGWVLSETHLAVETSVEAIPQKNGNPIPGKFEYKTDHSSSTTSYTYEIPLGDWKVGDTLVVAAHAVVQLKESGEVVQEETGWGEGDDFHGKNCAMYFEYTVKEGELPR